ncbi:hypothetical protein [Halomonas sp. SCS19]|uniref:SDH family Clp fold serine proteinase n=1 Tax=Halomonas sp. SCS19 TaxID=2950870 RepID=UPI0032DFCBD3
MNSQAVTNLEPLLRLEAHNNQSDPSEQEGGASEDAPFPVTAAVLERLDCDVFVFSGGIEQGLERVVAKLLGENENRPNEAILWLTTPGGSPDAAYLVARAFQRQYKKFSIFINSFCKSSGTLMCLGADELIMDQNGHLGPLDIQILNREEFGEHHSGLNPLEALNSLGTQATEFLKQQFLDVRFGGGLSTRQALEVSTNLAGHLFSPITAQLDFMKYGQFTRSMRIGLEYGNRLTKHRKFKNLKTNAVSRLAMEYPSHGFVVDREEARAELFTSVVDAPRPIQMLADELQPHIDKALLSAENSPLLLDLRQALGVTIPKDASDAGHQPGEADLETAVHATPAEATNTTEDGPDESHDLEDK